MGARAARLDEGIAAVNPGTPSHHDRGSNQSSFPDRELDQGPDKNTKRARFRIRFGLMDLLLLTVVVAAWLPVVITQRQIAKLKLEIQTLQPLATNLIVLDDQELNVRQVDSILPGITSWKYYSPLNADLELRFATEGINNFSFPTDYRAVPLPAGQHAIHLSEVNDTEGYHRELYIDKEKVLEQHLPVDAFARIGSSIQSDVSVQSEKYPITEPLKLRDERYTSRHPLQAYGQIDLPIHHDRKGNFLWISPRLMVPKPPPNLIVYEHHSQLTTIGHRQGIRVRRTNETQIAGLINIQPSISSVLGDQDRPNRYRFGISVRPVLEDDSKPELPELQLNSAMPGRPGMLITYRDTITPPSGTDPRTRHELVAENMINKGGDQMRLFAHYPSYTSGAQPIVEILFDAAHPNRIGFLPHAAPDSTPLKACQFVTQFDARFFWRKIEMRLEEEAGDNANLESIALVPLSQLYPQMDPATFAHPIGVAGASESAPTSFRWKPVSLDRLPRDEASNNVAEMFKLSLITDVSDSSKLKFPAGLPDGLQYEGVPNRQVWWLPAVEEVADPAKVDTPITVEVRASSVFPTTKIPLVGGPAVGNVRVTVPMPATEPIWLEIVADQPRKP